MKPQKTKNIKISFLLLLAGSTLCLFYYGCLKQEKADNITQSKTAAPGCLTDKHLKTYQKDLLTIAFDTASKIKPEPHIKDRSRAQEKVVNTAIDLDQPMLAQEYLKDIVNWRRGAVYGELAFYCAKGGYREEAEKYIESALKISETTEDWRRDSIKVKVAKAFTILGQNQKADSYAAHVEDSEAGKVAGVKAMMADKDTFDEQVKNLDALIKPGNFDITKNALISYTSLFDRFYDKPEHRSLVEEKIKGAWTKLPIFIRFELLLMMTDSAINHSDKRKALNLVNEAEQLIEGSRWPMEHYIKYKAQLIKKRYQAGDAKKAATDADALLALFKSQKDKIINIYRAGVLRPLAESYSAMNDKASSLAVYKMAVEEGVENPNSRPRAEDLSATCLSMALSVTEPDRELWERIRQIRDGLGDPW